MYTTLLHCWKDSRVRTPLHLKDYAFLVAQKSAYITFLMDFWEDGREHHFICCWKDHSFIKLSDYLKNGFFKDMLEG